MKRKPRRAKGTLNPDRKTKAIAIHFDRAVFERIADEAQHNGIAFGRQVRIYIDRGMTREGEA